MPISHRMGRGLLRGSVGLLTMAGLLAGPALAANAAIPPGGPPGSAPAGESAMAYSNGAPSGSCPG